MSPGYLRPVSEALDSWLLIEFWALASMTGCDEQVISEHRKSSFP